MTGLNIKEIMEYLPHRHPFLLVDKVLTHEDGKILGIKNVTVNEPFFTGHFPEKPVMPGVLIIEALAQISGILSFLTSGTKPSPSNWFYLAGVDKTRFRRVVLPGDQLILKAEVLKNKLDVWVFKATATVDDNLVCAAEIMTAKGA